MYFFDGYQKPSKMINFVFKASLSSVDRACTGLLSSDPEFDSRFDNTPMEIPLRS